MTTTTNDSPQDSHTHAVRLQRNNSVAIIRLGSPEEKTVVLSESRMNSLAQALDVVKTDESLKGIVIIGANIRSFCAGADINVISELTDISLAEKLAQMGQAVFAKISALTIPSVAAIGGPSVGGGCELALHCTHRILVDSPETKIGLPEIKLGILPGFGGTQLLPRLIGLPKALDIILKGRVVSASKAQRIGLADALYQPSKATAANISPEQGLLDFASSVALGTTSLNRKSTSLQDKLLTSFSFGRNIVYKRAKAQTRKATKGHYPAPLRALEVVMHGLNNGLEEGLKEEAKALAELIITPESKALVHVFFLTEKATKRWRAAVAEIKDLTIGVIGAGTMGSGIAAALLGARHNVVLVEPIEPPRAAARERIRGILSKKRSRTEAEIQALLERLTVTSSYENLSSAGLVIEAVIEELTLKKRVFESIEQNVAPEAIIATNTSSLPISDIATVLHHPDRVIGMHFFNPAERMPLVEVIRAERTNERSLAHTAAVAVKLGKFPVIASEVPGFLVNRILTPYLLEGAFLVKDGYAFKDIDKAGTGFGMPMGPLRLLDEIGLDVAAEVSKILEKAYGNRMTSPKLSSALVEAGRLGKKSGKGFYVYQDQEVLLDEDVRELMGLSSARAASSSEFETLTDRLILSMVNEAVRSLDEGVAGIPGRDAAEQIDLASVMGTGFAPFRGGVIHYAETTGAQSLLDRLTKLERDYGERFAPAEGIRNRAAKGLSFYQEHPPG